MLEITVQRRKGDVYPVVAEHHRQGSLLPVRSEGSFPLLTEPSSPLPRTYGTALGKVLFRDDIRDALKAVVNDDAGGARILLHVEAEELRTWRWEWLCAPFEGGSWDFLSLNQQKPFSLYLPSLAPGAYPPIGRRDLRALVVVANPSDPTNKYGFSPFNADQNIACLKALFARQRPIVEADILSRSEGVADLPTFDGLISQLTKGTPSGPYTILHLVCHGRLNRESGETYLYLEQAELDPESGKALAQPVKGSELIDQLRRISRLPYLVFLSVCESSAPEAEQRLGGIAQRLVRELGIPAVIGMTEPVTVITAQPLAEAFYDRLLAQAKRGEVDRALVEAYARLLASRPDVNVPALYSRLADQPLFNIALDKSRVPMMAPEPPADFVQRPVEFAALKAKLLDAKGGPVAITAALRGAGGYGKTTLAKALAHDPDIEDAYFDGTLWAELGEKPENLLSIISDLITRLTGTPPGLGTVNAAASALGEALRDRRILLVIDDAWREQDLRPFLEGGSNTTRLITTRRDDILPVRAKRQEVDAMAADEALALLSWDLPEDRTAQQTQALSALAQRLGEWAQLLKLVNGFLRDRVIKNHEPLPQAIAGVNKRLDLKGFTAFDAKNEASRANAIAKTIGVSLDLLNERERARFAELAVFPEDADVPLGVVSRLWRETDNLDEIDTEDLLQRLQNLSLLLSLDLDRRTFRFHDTVRHFLQDRAGGQKLAGLHERLLKALDRIDADAGADDALRHYYFLHRPAHLNAAGDRAGLDALLQDPAWLKAKLDTIGSPQALIADYDQFARGELQDLIARTLQLFPLFALATNASFCHKCKAD